MRRNRMLVVVLGLVLCTGVAGWLCRDFFQAKYFVFRLNHAAEQEVGAWVEESAEWGSAIMPALLAQLTVDDEEKCRRAGAALARLSESKATSELMAILPARFESLSFPGQAWALQQIVLTNASDGESRQVIESAIKSSSALIRRQAIRSATAIGCHELAAPLICDPDVEIRRAVVLALGSNRDWLSDDDLLPRLHDSDREVQRLARLALRSRGLTEMQVRFARMLTDSNPTARLELILELRGDSELDLRQWLNRLCDDPSPAVRVAAARTAAELRVFQLTDRIAELANADPESTVRQIAQHHLMQLQGAQRSNEP